MKLNQDLWNAIHPYLKAGEVETRQATNTRLAEAYIRQPKGTGNSFVAAQSTTRSKHFKANTTTVAEMLSKGLIATVGEAKAALGRLCA